MSPDYLPDAGDLVWLEFDPQAGHEQAGRRPGLVLSPVAYNKPSGLMIVCPITNQAKGYPFEVSLPSGLKIQGVVLVDQVKNLDWKARNADKSDVVPRAVMDDVLAKLSALLCL
ncbi:MAG: endoribonuclease MazF [Proteobacteria bacterium]|nr:endoribonuclease MazF [Pseudomonadota bacterium]MBU1449535.1 endoribonuclease MazF [Pseudomonadota bacterium]MBU2467018.1 endoribonuclease MazF [Pseudomonadota bacterium]